MKASWTTLGRGPGFKVVLIVGIVGVLTLGLGLQNDVVRERQSSRDEAVSRTVDEWGGEQKFAGPFLKVPYREFVAKGQQQEVRRGFAYLLPQDFRAFTELSTETRTRGIYEVPLYRANVSVTGAFALPESAAWFPRGAEVDWAGAELWVFVGKAGGLDAKPVLTFDGHTLTPVRAPFDTDLGLEALSAPVDLGAVGVVAKFDIQMALKGGASFGVLPAGADSVISLTSDHGQPTFGGSFLPSKRSLGTDGFQAEWRIPALARSLPSRGTVDTWKDVLSSGIPFASAGLGVAFDAYRLLDRALKYGLLFIIVPFIALFLYELFLKRRLHPIQYFLVGLAVLMFYLLVLTLSEHVPFDGAFAIGALAVCLLLGVYGVPVLGGRGAGVGFAAGMAVLYGLLLLIIRSEDNALLVGTLFLFVLLTVVMVSTRGVDWYRLGRSEVESQE